MTPDKTVLLYTFNSLPEAVMALDKLKQNGIDAFLENENPIGLNPLGGVELKIFSNDREESEKLIAEFVASIY